VPARHAAPTTVVDAGDVISVDPEEGTRIEPESTVTLVVSTGPAQHTLEKLSGQSVDAVRDILTANNVNVADQVDEYFSDLDDGLVLNVRITPRAGGDAYACGDGCTVYEDDTALVQRSLGPVPNVAGKSVDDAVKTLQDARLKVADQRPAEWSDSVAEGKVIWQSAERQGGGLWRPGDTVTIAVSKGPKPIDVPRVVDMTLSEAKKKLSDVGLKADYAAWGDLPGFGDMALVVGQDPGDDRTLPKGGTVKLEIQLRG
jgi:serine/threonine-protein kinase